MRGTTPTNSPRTIAVIGGAGYVGSALVPHLLDHGHTVRVLDIFWYGRDIFGAHAANPRLTLHPLDVRETAPVRAALRGVDTIVHLACISNDPSYDLDPAFARTINRDTFGPLLDAAAEGGVRRFIYASSSSVYGTREEADITELTPTNPLAGYSADKLACEEMLSEHPSAMERIIVRPATVCGYAPRMRFDLIVNALTIHALVNRRIRVIGGAQARPNLHVADMVAAYARLIDAAPELVDRQVFNVGCENGTVLDLGHRVQTCLADLQVDLEIVPQPDARSYRVNADKIANVLGFRPAFGIEDAVRDIRAAWDRDEFSDPLTNPLYHNIRRVRDLLATDAVMLHR